MQLDGYAKRLKSSQTLKSLSCKITQNRDTYFMQAALDIYYPYPCSTPATAPHPSTPQKGVADTIHSVLGVYITCTCIYPILDRRKKWQSTTTTTTPTPQQKS